MTDTNRDLDALDEAVARLEGWAPHLEPLEHWLRREPEGSYCRDWMAGGPIIERERITLIAPDERPDQLSEPRLLWTAAKYVVNDDEDEEEFEECGPTPLVAAMRAYVASKKPEDTPHD